MSDLKHVKTSWKGGMAFESEIDGHRVLMDANEEIGGTDKGPTPKPLLLAAVAGCTGMDVASLLKKMRVEVDDLEIDVQAESTDEHPRYYHKIHINYFFKGQNLDKTKIEKAVNLSQERYCGVSFMLGKAAELTFEVHYL